VRRIPAIDWRTTKTRSTVDSSDVRLGSNWTFSGRIYPVFYIRKSYQVALDSSGFIYFLILFYLFLFCLDWVTRERKCRSRNERVRPSNGICQRILSAEWSMSWAKRPFIRWWGPVDPYSSLIKIGGRTLPAPLIISWFAHIPYGHLHTNKCTSKQPISGFYYIIPNIINAS